MEEGNTKTGSDKSDNIPPVVVEVISEVLETKDVSDSAQCKQEDSIVRIEVQPASGDIPKPSSNDSSENTEKLNPEKKENLNSEKKENQTLKRKQPLQEEPVSKKLRETILFEANNDSFSDEEDYYMTILDVPKDVQIQKYLEECGAQNKVEPLKVDKNQVKLASQSSIDHKKALKKVMKEAIKGKKVRVRIPEQASDIDNASDAKEIIRARSWRPDEDVYETDPLGLYGLKIDFLKSLDISPPIDKWVHVSNFKCEKYELREVMELAGDVLTCSIIMINKRFAKVQYSHPLEAVQAVSMLNGQLYCGLRLKVFLEKNPRNDVILPKGLGDIGLGLGLQGRPVRDIVRQYERYVRHQNSTVNPILFRKQMGDDGNSKDQDKKGGNQISVDQFIEFTKTKSFHERRSFKIKHVEELDASCDVLNRNNNLSWSRSPESSSVVSLDSAFHNDAKELENLSNLNGGRTASATTSLPEPERPGTTVSTSLGQVNPTYTTNLTHQNVLQNPAVRSQELLIAAFRPCPPGVQQVQFTNRQYFCQLQTGPANVMPNPMSIQMPYTTTNQISNDMSNVMPNPMSNVMPNPMSNVMPNPMSNVMPNPMSNAMPNLLSNAMPNSMSNAMPNPLSNAMPNSMSNQLTSTITNQMSNPIPNMMSNIMANQMPSSMPKQMLPIGGQQVQSSFGPSQPFATQMAGPGPAGPSVMHGGAVAWSVHGSGTISGPVQRPGPTSTPGPVHGPRPVPGPIGPPGNKATVQFSNLPPSTTFPYLCEKLIQCGHVVSLQFTTPGCAVATFSHPSYAERCYHIIIEIR